MLRFRSERSPLIFSSSKDVVGGSYWYSQGGGSNHLCLRNDPIFRKDDPGVASTERAEVYGAQYASPPKSQLHTEDIPCAVCQVTRRTAYNARNQSM